MISIIVPTYNRQNLIKDAIQSVVKQTYKDWELIIVDDGSTDNTKSIVSEYTKKDSRIRYFYKKNGGQGSARNLGVLESKGEYVAFLDSDDEWLEDKLEKQISFLEKNKSASFCYTKSVSVFPNGKRKYFGQDTKKLYRFLLMGIGTSSLSSVLFVKKDLLRIGLFDEATELIGLEDNEHGIRTSNLVGVYLDEPLTLYKYHDFQITKENMKNRLGRQIAGLSYILEKNRKILERDKKALSFRQKQIGHLCMLHGDYIKARKTFAIALQEYPSVIGVALYLSSFFSSIYIFIYKIRNMFLGQ